MIPQGHKPGCNCFACKAHRKQEAHEQKMAELSTHATYCKCDDCITWGSALASLKKKEHIYSPSCMCAKCVKKRSKIQAKAAREARSEKLLKNFEPVEIMDLDKQDQDLTRVDKKVGYHSARLDQVERILSQMGHKLKGYPDPECEDTGSTYKSGSPRTDWCEVMILALCKHLGIDSSVMYRMAKARGEKEQTET